MGGRTIQPPCAECGMVGLASEFHPHVYCMLYKAGVTDPESYMHATMPMLAEHFGFAIEGGGFELVDTRLEADGPRLREMPLYRRVGGERDESAP